jgi:hypothetical protein
MSDAVGVKRSDGLKAEDPKRKTETGGSCGSCAFSRPIFSPRLREVFESAGMPAIKITIRSRRLKHSHVKSLSQNIEVASTLYHRLRALPWVSTCGAFWRDSKVFLKKHECKAESGNGNANRVISSVKTPAVAGHPG